MVQRMCPDIHYTLAEAFVIDNLLQVLDFESDLHSSSKLAQGMFLAQEILVRATLRCNPAGDGWIHTNSIEGVAPRYGRKRRLSDEGVPVVLTSKLLVLS